MAFCAYRYRNYRLWLLLFLSTEGHKAHRALQDTMMQLDREIITYRDEIEQYDTLIQDWHRYPYYQESVMREELQYIYPEEELFCYTN